MDKDDIQAIMFFGATYDCKCAVCDMIKQK
ncbi:hypothetical protein LCGC14_2849550, partial [marine sediment metagenome]